MEEQLKQLINKRTSIKASVTRFSTYLKSISSENIDYIHIKERKSKFEETWAQFHDIQANIDLINDEVDSDQYSAFEASYFDIKTKIEKLLLDHVTNNSTPLSGRVESTDTQLQNQIRLPKINLPNFGGSYEDWYTFHDTFNSLIHSNSNISQIQKFHYLKSALHGEASEVLHSLEITENNYVNAWTMLKERYDNKRIIIQKHIKSIFEMPAINKESYTGLRQILDGALKHIRALKSLKRPTDSWDDLLIYIITSKIDPLSNKEWESKMESASIPTLNELTNFLANKCQILEAVSRREQPQNSCSNKVNNTKKALYTASSKPHCFICNQDHLLYYCDKFAKMSIDQRIKEAKSKKLCLNCLKPNHHINNCTSSTCKKCNKKHNTLLHIQQQSSKPAMVSENLETSKIAHQNYHANVQSQVLLSTAVIDVYDGSGKLQHCRALLDSGSQSSFITESLVKRLHLHKVPTNISLAGINQSLSQVKHTVNVKIKSRYNGFNSTLRCLILDRITECLPTNSISSSDIKIPRNIKLADPQFNISSNIDMLIGAELFWSLLCVGQIKTSKRQPYLQKTHLGWIVSGQIMAIDKYANKTSCNLSINDSLDNSLTRFWEVEEYTPKCSYTIEEKACEDHFINTFRRNEDGRFVVKLPFKTQFETRLGESKGMALKRFYNLERKLRRQPALKQQYSDFIEEYLALGHMKIVPAEREAITPNFYLPHHAVLKESSLTTKLRVVFDGSAKTSTGTSLNDMLMVGPVIQQDLFSIILRFRMHRFVMTADIAKMYRQVHLDESQIQFQRILWRNEINERIKSYELTTVTYGTASASYLAIKALHQLAIDEKGSYPIGAMITKRDFYVDDLLTGADTKEEAEIIRNEVSLLLEKGKFQLRKWASNCSDLIQNISSNETEHAIINLDKQQTIKTLGLQWNSSADVFQFKISKFTTSRISKRTILSDISQIFDPLGLIGPVIVIAKLLMQRLWQLNLDWDESTPTDVHTAWFEYKKQIQTLNILSIPRWVISDENPVSRQIHGFCDASELAYGACIYMRITNMYGHHSSNLICSKSRVAPLRNISVPKLELCAALLLARLMKKVTAALPVRIDDIHYWTDSTITLAWIKSVARNWKTFVANRVSEIQELSNLTMWHHVPTTENPADIISRGLEPILLIKCALWWHGPTWFQSHSDHWPNIPSKVEISEDIPERRSTISNVLIATNSSDFDIFERYSKLNKLLRVTAYCLRFIHNCCKRLKGMHNELEGESLTPAEITNATVILTKIVQQSVFPQDMLHLKVHNTVHCKSKLLCLNPFLDNAGIIRVGGRLNNADIPYNQKHPIVLPKNHKFTKLIIQNEHHKCLHAGAQATLAAVRMSYWPLGGRDITRHLIRQCIRCFRTKPINESHIMGNLPKDRVTPSRPFTNCGIDYFGPLMIREGKRRNSRYIKAYGAIFICFSTKAVHIELVTDLSTETFINALKRFIARRGKPVNMYSDNGTNFVGAKREIRELYDMFRTESSQNAIISQMANNLIHWHFIPAKSPHFGGLWEAGVKSFKQHLKRVSGNAALNFEEMYTLLIQIEAVINSRPLIPLSNDPSDFSCLTPGHFLIGDSLLSITEPSLANVHINRLSRWQRVEQIRHHFWTRWSKEYLSQLQQRSKWKTNTATNLAQGQLVIIREDNLPPLHWLMGRIESVHPGNDGIVRTATVRTASGIFKRATAKLCLLPIDNN